MLREYRFRARLLYIPRKYYLTYHQFSALNISILFITYLRTTFLQEIFFLGNIPFSFCNSGLEFRSANS
jgi:hypothetical protein